MQYYISNKNKAIKSLHGGLLINLKPKIRRHCIDTFHDFGQLVLVINPLFIFQKEIEFEWKSCIRALFLTHEESQLLVYISVSTEKTFDETTIKCHVHDASFHLFRLEIFLLH